MWVSTGTQGRRSTRSQNIRPVSLPSTSPRNSETAAASSQPYAKLQFKNPRTRVFAVGPESPIGHDESYQYLTIGGPKNDAPSSTHDESESELGSDIESIYSTDSAAEQLLNECHQAARPTDNELPQTSHCKDCFVAEQTLTRYPLRGMTLEGQKEPTPIIYTFLNTAILISSCIWSSLRTTHLSRSNDPALLSHGPIMWLFADSIRITKLLESKRKLLPKDSCSKALAKYNLQMDLHLEEGMRFASRVFLYTVVQRSPSSFCLIGLLLFCVEQCLFGYEKHIQKHLSVKRSLSKIYTYMLFFTLAGMMLSFNITHSFEWPFAKWYANHHGGWLGSDYHRHKGMNPNKCNPHDVNPSLLTRKTMLNQKEAIITYAPIACKYLSAEDTVYGTPMSKTTRSQMDMVTSEDTLFAITTSRESSTSKNGLPLITSSQRAKELTTRGGASNSIPITSSQSAVAKDKVSSAAQKGSLAKGKLSGQNILASLWQAVETSQDESIKEDKILNSIETDFQVEFDDVPLSLTETVLPSAADTPSQASLDLQIPQTAMTEPRSLTTEQSDSVITGRAPALKRSSISGATTWTITASGDGAQESNTFWVFDDNWATKWVGGIGRRVRM